jgi:predicted 3-demethylubiquinone-9 3-methyltransferase (glyoxalase superfamily)
MTPKNTICLWFDKDAEDAARFYVEPRRSVRTDTRRSRPASHPSDHL